MFRCTFCRTSVSHIGENAVQTGWGRLVISKGNWPEKISAVHCPDHIKEYVDLVISLATAKNVTAAKQLIEEAQRDR